MRHRLSFVSFVPLVSFVCAVGALLGLVQARASAHEIPSDVTIQLWMKPEAQHLRLLVRVPLVAMRDFNFPTRGTAADGILDIARADPTLRDAATLWVGDDIELYEGDARLPYPAVIAVRASLPSDRSFSSYEGALAHVTGPRLSDDTELRWSEGLLDVLFEYPIQSDRSRFSIRPKLYRLGLRTQTVLRLMLPDGTVRAFDFHGDPGFVRLDPRWHQAALRFVKLGFQHILDGTDHLLFLFCLVIPFRRLRSLVIVVTSFTVAHSITLIASAYNFAPDSLWFPPLIETLIAASIVYMAIENIVFSSASAFSAVSAVQRRWMITFAFGLVHGFGFSFALRQTLQFAGSHLLTSLLSFNIGVELGQLLVLVALIPLLNLAFRRFVDERLGTIVLSAFVAHTAWHWLTERWSVLREYRMTLPTLDLMFWVSAMRVAMVLVALAGLYWFVRQWRPLAPSQPESSER